MAVLASASAFAVQPGMTGRAATDDTFNPGCPAQTAVPQVTKQVLNFTGSLTCYRPGNIVKFGTNVAPGNTVVRDVAPTLGEECRNYFNHPVVFSEDFGGNPKSYFAFAGGATAGTWPLSDDDARMMGTHDAFVTDVQLGSYELSDPNDSNSKLECVINPTYHFYCPGPPAQLDVLCYRWQVHPIVDPVPAPRELAPYFATTIGSLNAQAGVIHSAPSQKGVVNTSQCFWIDSMGIPREQDLTLILPGPVDSSGRQVFFTFFARIVFTGVRWDFGDYGGNNSQVAVPAECAGHPQVVAHQYSRISDERNPDRTFHVQAFEDYSITVVVYWIDSRGAFGPIPVDPGVAAPTLTPGTLAQYVGQIEGVPVSGG